MSEPSVSVSNNKSSLASWWKSFKRKSLVVDDLHGSGADSGGGGDRDLAEHDLHEEYATEKGLQNLGKSQNLQPGTVGPRPILKYKSRSSNYIKPLSSSASSSENFRAHRDSFLESQKLKNNNDSQIFGVPLEQVLRLASVNISISEDLANEGIQYGAIPVVVGKCCVFLKKNGTEVEGVFRVGGASRRVKELQFLFSTPPEYGRRMDWDGYTVHDAASLLRRFLNSLPEPLIPLAMYERFREPLRSKPLVRSFLSKKGSSKKSHSHRDAKKLDPAIEDVPDDTTELEEKDITESNKEITVTEKDLANVENELAESSDPVPTETPVTGDQVLPDTNEVSSQDTPAKDNSEEQTSKKQKKMRKYKKLISEIHETLREYSVLLNELPSPSQHLLFYILDLLTVFATHSSKNLMTNKNLAAIFQPSVLSHPDHDMSPEEYALSLQVVEFLLEYYRRLLEATQKIQSERSWERKQKAVPALELTTDDDLIKKGHESDGSSNTPITPSSLHLHPPISKRSSRKHSKSLSSVNAVPDGLKFSSNKPADDKMVYNQYNSTTDADDSELEAGRLVTPTAQSFQLDAEDQLLSPPLKPFSPLRKKRSEESLNNSNSLLQNFKRPLSAVFSPREKDLDELIDDDRESRRDLNEDVVKKDNWFTRMRSRSRSTEPRLR